jgi:hypothetical protein
VNVAGMFIFFDGIRLFHRSILRFPANFSKEIEILFEKRLNSQRPFRV